MLRETTRPRPDEAPGGFADASGVGGNWLSITACYPRCAWTFLCIFLDVLASYRTSVPSIYVAIYVYVTRLDRFPWYLVVCSRMTKTFMLMPSGMDPP